MSARYPNVPNLPGVPPVFRDLSNSLTGQDIFAADELTQDGEIIVQSTNTAWGIYTQTGEKALDIDSMLAVDPSQEYRISDYPVEAGGFQSYNKVTMPGETRLTVTKGGNASVRQAFLNSLAELARSIETVSVLTPDENYLDRNLVRFDYRRTADSGATLLIVDLMLVEVRQTAESEYMNSKFPSGADVVNDGPVRPETPNAAQTPMVPAT